MDMGILELLLKKHLNENFIEKQTIFTTGRPIRQRQLQRSDCGALNFLEMH